MTTIALTKKYTKTKALGVEPAVFKVLIGSLLLLIVSYLFLVGHITFSILARKSAESHMKAITGDISALELEYLNLDSSVDLSAAHALGFQDAATVVFAQAQSEEDSVGLLNR